MWGVKVLNNKLGDAIGGITRNPNATIVFINVKENIDYILEKMKLL